MRVAAPHARAQEWRLAGKALLGTYDHIYVLTLPDSPRAAHMRALLRLLAVPPDRYTLFEGAACQNWGRWDSVPLLKREREGATGGHAGRWWLPPVRRGTSSNLCTLADEKALAPPPSLFSRFPPPPRPYCLRARYARCIVNPGSGAALPRMCNELCYTLSVAGALDAFVRSPDVRPVDSQRTDARALLLEDDICATTALLRHDGRTLVRELSAAGAPDVVKLGDCYRGVEGIVPKRRTLSAAEQLTTGACAAPKGGRAAAGPLRNATRNALLDGVPRTSYCTHALGVTRRAAAHLLAQAFPASDVFDGLLTHQIVRLRGANVSFATANYSLFAQVAKTAEPTPPAALRSQNHGAALRLGEGMWLANVKGVAKGAKGKGVWKGKGLGKARKP